MWEREQRRTQGGGRKRSCSKKGRKEEDMEKEKEEEQEAMTAGRGGRQAAEMGALIKSFVLEMSTGVKIPSKQSWL